MMKILFILCLNMCNLAALTATQKQVLKSLAGNDCYAASYARGILRVLGEDDGTYREPMPHLGSNMMLRTKKKAAKAVQEPTFKVYPNPAQEYIVVEMNRAEVSELVITDVLGRIVYQKQVPAEATTLTIPVTEWQQGNYTYRISVENHTEFSGVSSC